MITGVYSSNCKQFLSKPLPVFQAWLTTVCCGSTAFDLGNTVNKLLYVICEFITPINAYDFNHGEIINKGNFFQREICAPWHTANTTHAGDNSNTLPEQYFIILENQ